MFFRSGFEALALIDRPMLIADIGPSVVSTCDPDFRKYIEKIHGISRNPSYLICKEYCLSQIIQVAAETGLTSRGEVFSTKALAYIAQMFKNTKMKMRWIHSDLLQNQPNDENTMRPPEYPNGTPDVPEMPTKWCNVVQRLIRGDMILVG